MIERRKPSKPGGNYFSAPTKTVFIPTGSKMLDLALGGGWAKGRIINIIGDTSAGKTLLCIEAGANYDLVFPKEDINYREAESAWIDDYARAMGMPVDRVNFGNGKLDTIEDFFEDLDDVLARAKRPFLHMLDSLDSLSDREEQKRAIDKGSYGGGKAKKLSELFRRRVRTMEEKGCTLIVVSQVRDRIGAMYGDKTTRSGGRALGFYSSQIVKLGRIGQIVRKSGALKRVTGVRIRARVTKNKVGMAFREADFPIKFAYGIDDVTSCIEFLESIRAPRAVIQGALSDMKEATFKREILHHSPGYKDLLGTLHEAVQREWYAIEAESLPPKPKYGD